MITRLAITAAAALIVGPAVFADGFRLRSRAVCVGGSCSRSVGSTVIIEDDDPDIIVIEDNDPDVIVIEDNDPDIIIRDNDPDIIVVEDDDPDIVVIDNDRDRIVIQNDSPRVFRSCSPRRGLFGRLSIGASARRAARCR